METFLAMDIGAGTQDILLYERGVPIENCIKLVLPSRAWLLAGMVEEYTREGRDIFLEGAVMGSGRLGSMLKKHIRAGYKVYATPESGRTIRDNLDEVRDRGIIIADSPPKDMVLLQLTDIALEPLHRIFAAYGKPLPSQYLIAVQDHGECLQGSNRQIRFDYWRSFLEGGGRLRDLLFYDIPPLFTRMHAVRRQVEGAALMDTGPAALQGSLYDPLVRAHVDEGVVLVNVGNQHTLAALIKGETVMGLMEHHTCFMNPEKIRDLVERFRTGILTHQEVFGEKGHGCVILDRYRDEAPFSFVSVTGPRREMASTLGYHFAAPFGDMMLTGCFGLLGAAGLLE